MLTRVGGVDRLLEKSLSSLSSVTSVGHLLFLFVFVWSALGPSSCMCLWCVCCLGLGLVLFLTVLTAPYTYLRTTSKVKVDRVVLWFERGEERRNTKTNDN
jgi:hypothetical protein